MKKESLKRKVKTPTAARRSPAKAPKNANESLLRTAWMAEAGLGFSAGTEILSYSLCRTAWMAEAALALLLSVSAVIVAAVY